MVASLKGTQDLVSKALKPVSEEGAAASLSAAFDLSKQGAGELAVEAEVPAASLAGDTLSLPRKEAARRELAIDKADESEQLRTQGLVRRWEKLYLAGVELSELGRGAFGAVYAHPRIKGAVIKMVALSAAAAFAFGGSDLKVAEQDYLVGKKIAEAGAGPEVLGIVSIPGEPSALRTWVWRLFGRKAAVPDRPAVVKERIFGETVEDLIAVKRFTERDYGLVQDMLQRLADARIRPWDLRIANVMVGTTESDPEPKAYLVDAGWLKPVAEAESSADLLESLKRQQTVVFEFGGGSANWGGGPERSLDPFDDLLRAGVARSSGRK